MKHKSKKDRKEIRNRGEGKGRKWHPNKPKSQEWKEQKEMEDEYDNDY